MPRGKLPPGHPGELERLREELRRAKDDLYFLQTTIIELMPSRQRELLASWARVRNLVDLDDWSKWVIQGLLDIVERCHGPEKGTRISQMRAMCPLCDRGAVTPDCRGFAFPIGLERHLAGSHGSRRCHVLDAAYTLALDDVRSYSNPNSILARMKGPHFTEGPKPWEAVPASREPASAVNVVALRPAKEPD